jgi:hypothetical protein
VLWEMILSHVDNTELWTHCRQVCSLFRETVEYDFKNKLLQRDMIIEVDLDWDYLDQEKLDRKTFFGFQMEFDRFKDSEETIAIFSRAVNFDVEDMEDDEEEESEGEAVSNEAPAPESTIKSPPTSDDNKDVRNLESIGLAEKKLQARMEREKLEEKFSIYTRPGATGAQAVDSRFDLPPWTIEIGGLVNDTELPAWSFDYAKHELSFNWAGAMEAFFRESSGMRREARKLVSILCLYNKQIANAW